MNHYHALILLGGLAVVAFLWDMLSRRTRIPTVLFLLATGIGMRAIADGFGWQVPGFDGFLQGLGSVGLVFIVFEGALDLLVLRERRALLFSALASAGSVLLLSAFALAVLYHMGFGAPWRQAWIQAAPLAVVSSAVAIPSARSLDEHRREFVVYESTFSDILGILLFNFLVGHDRIDTQAFMSLGMDALIVAVVSLLATVSLLYLVAKAESASKYTLLFALLVIAYAVGKLAHLPTLLLVFVLGICLNNARLLPLPFIAKGTAVRRLHHELRVLKRLTGEGSFLLRAYFFVLFGFSIQASAFVKWRDLALGLLTLALLTAVRGSYLAIQLRRTPFPEVFMAPRGLITILLFYSIPTSLAMHQVGRESVLVVILGSTVLMTAGLLFHARAARQAQEGADGSKAVSA